MQRLCFLFGEESDLPQAHAERFAREASEAIASADSDYKDSQYPYHFLRKPQWYAKSIRATIL